MNQSTEYIKLKDSLRNEAIFLLSHRTGQITQNRGLQDRLLKVTRNFYPNLEINKSCSSCVGKAYQKLSKVYDNFSFIDVLMEKKKEEAKGKYLLKAEIDKKGYRFGKAMIRNSVSEALRKQVYESDESRKALFIPESIPTNKPVAKKTTAKKPATKKTKK